MTPVEEARTRTRSGRLVVAVQADGVTAEHVASYLSLGSAGKDVVLTGLTEVGRLDLGKTLHAAHVADVRRREAERDAKLAAAADPEAPRLTLVLASSVAMDRPCWVWERRLPVGGTTLMAGREGLGKTALAIWLAARISRGQLDGAYHGQPRDVIYIGMEDDRATVTVPRLVAAGADLARFHFVDIIAGGTFTVGVDLAALAEVADGLDVALIVVDPLDSHLGHVDTHRKSEVQAAIAMLAGLAQRLRCAALGLGHLNKGDLTDLLSRVVGSVGFTTAVRSVLGVGEHPENDGEVVCALAKANMTDRRTVPALRFKVEGTTVEHPDGGTIDTGRVVILGEEDGFDPDSVLTGDREARGARAAAVEWLTAELSGGPRRRADIMERADLDDIAERTLKRAAKAMGVLSDRAESEQGRPAMWRLPDGPPGFGPRVSGQNGEARNIDASDQGKHTSERGYGPSFRVARNKPEEDDVGVRPCVYCGHDWDPVRLHLDPSVVCTAARPEEAL